MAGYVVEPYLCLSILYLLAVASAFKVTLAASILDCSTGTGLPEASKIIEFVSSIETTDGYLRKCNC